jgi:hypothetical protein
MTTRYNFDTVNNFINKMTLKDCEKCFLYDISIGRTGYGQYNGILTFIVDGAEIQVKQHTTDSLIIDEEDYESYIGMILNLFDSFDVSEYIQEKI